MDGRLANSIPRVQKPVMKSAPYLLMPHSATASCPTDVQVTVSGACVPTCEDHGAGTSEQRTKMPANITRPRYNSGIKRLYFKIHQEIQKANEVETSRDMYKPLGPISTSQGARSARLLAAGKLQVVPLGGDSHLPLASHGRQWPAAMPTWADL